MKESDQAATAFITPYGPFCFNTMAFRLKNAGATYQCMIQTCLENQIGKIMEAYIDDVVIKTKHVESLVDDYASHSTTSEHMTYGSIRKNVSSAFQPENYSCSSFPIEELKRTQQRSEPYRNWIFQKTSNRSRN